MAVSWVAAGTLGASTAGVSVPLPAGIAAGDILLLFVTSANETTAGVSTGDIAAPSGWAMVTGTGSANNGQGAAAGATSTRLTVFWLRYTGVETAPTVADTGDHNVAVIHAFRGCVASGNPWDVVNAGTDVTSDTSLDATGVTTTAAGEMIVVGTASETDIATARISGTPTNASLTGIAVRSDGSSTSGSGGGIAVFTGVLAGTGASGTTSAVYATATLKSWVTIALVAAPPSVNALAGAASGTGTAPRPAVASGPVSATAGAASATGTAPAPFADYGQPRRVNKVSIGANSGAAAAYTATIPAGTGILAGDLIIVCANSNGTHAANGMACQDSVNAVPFTTIREQDLSGSSSRWLQTFAYKTPADIPDGATISFTPYALANASSFTVDIFRGFDATISRAATGVSPAAGTTCAAPALASPPPANDLVLSFTSFATSTGGYPTVAAPFTRGSVQTTTPSTATGYVLAADGTSTYGVTWTSDTSQSTAGITVSFARTSTNAVSATAGQAAGTGTAPAPSLTAAGNAAPGPASGTGTAPAPVPALTAPAPAGPATGTGTGPAPVVTAASSAAPGQPAGTGTAPAVTAAYAVPAPAGPAQAAGSAPGVTAQTSAGTSALPGPAQATGTAPAPALTAASRGIPGAPAGTGTAPAPAPALASRAAPGPGQGTGSAPAPALAAASNAAPGQAPGTGTAPAVTASTAAAGTAQPGLAAGTGTAPAVVGQPAKTAAPGPAAGTGTSPAPAVTAGVAGSAGPAQATGTAPAPAFTAASRAAPGPAAGTGTAPGAAAQPARTAAAGQAAGTGTSPAVLAVLAAQAYAALAAALGEAPPAGTHTAIPAMFGTATTAGAAVVSATTDGVPAAAATAGGAVTGPDVTTGGKP
jgi:hypothetical protein